MSVARTLALARHTGRFASERRTSWRVCFSGTSIDAAIKYGENSTLCFASSVPLSPTLAGRMARCIGPPFRKHAACGAKPLHHPRPSRERDRGERGLNFPPPSWGRDRGRGVTAQLGFNIFSCRINIRLDLESLALVRCLEAFVSGKRAGAEVCRIFCNQRCVAADRPTRQNDTSPSPPDNPSHPDVCSRKTPHNVCTVYRIGRERTMGTMVNP